MSDVEVVSQYVVRNPDAVTVPYGSIFGDDDIQSVGARHSFSEYQEGVIPAVSYDDQLEKGEILDLFMEIATPVKRGPGRPKKVVADV